MFWRWCIAAVDDVVGPVIFVVYFALVVLHAFEIPVLEVVLLVVRPVDDVEVIVGGVFVLLLPVLVDQGLRLVLRGQAVGRVQVHDIVIHIVLVVVLLNRPRSTMCAICPLTRANS